MMADIAALLAQGSRFNPLGAASQGLQLGQQFQNLQQSKLNQILQQQQAEQQQKLGGLQIEAAEQALIDKADAKQLKELTRKTTEATTLAAGATSKGDLVNRFNSAGIQLDEALLDPTVDVDTAKDIIAAKAAAYNSSIANRVQNLPKSVQEFIYRQSLTPEQDKEFLKGKRTLPEEAGLKARLTEEGKLETQKRLKPGVEAATEAAKETAKLSAQLKLQPKIKAAVQEVVSDAKLSADIKKEERSNAKAKNLYDTAMSGLAGALGETTTGPGVGSIPAITSNQQIADGAVAAMAPILKQMFRSAGEGTFTDNDQKLLLDMVPTRKDTPKARIAKIKNIDAIVKAKLESPDNEGWQKIGDFEIRQK